MTGNKFLGNSQVCYCERKLNISDEVRIEQESLFLGEADVYKRFILGSLN